MVLLLILSPEIPPHITCIRGVVVKYKLIIRSTIPGDESGLNSRANIVGTSGESDVLQDNRLKKYHLPVVPFPSLYAFELHCKG